MFEGLKFARSIEWMKIEVFDLRASPSPRLRKVETASNKDERRWEENTRKREGNWSKVSRGNGKSAQIPKDGHTIADSRGEGLYESSCEIQLRK